MHLKTPSHKTQVGGICSGFFLNTFLYSPDYRIKCGLDRNPSQWGDIPVGETTVQLGFLFINHLTLGDE